MKGNNKFSFSLLKDMLVNSKRVLGIVWGENKILVVSIVLSFIVVGIMPIAISGARGYLVNELIKASKYAHLSSGVTLALILTVLASLLFAVFVVIEKILDRKFFFFIQEKFELLILKKRGEIDIQTYENPKYSSLFTRVNDNFWRINSFSDRQFFMLQDVFGIIVSSAIIISAKWWLFVLILALSIPELITEAIHGTRIYSINNSKGEEKKTFWNLRYNFIDIPRLIELKAFQNIKYFYNAIKELLTGFNRAEFASEKKKFFQETFSTIISQIGIAFAIVNLAFDVIHNQLQVGTFIFFISSIGSLRQAFSGLFLNLGRQYQDCFFVSDIFKMLDLKSVVKKSELAVELSPKYTPEIIFQNVSFKYPETEKLVLKNFNLKISPGEKLAMIGVNGAGKTTIIKLLARFYDPIEGKILIDGKDLKTINLETWYAKLGIIFQEYSNYDFIVKDAIGIGRTDDILSLEKVKESARSSEASVFIEDWEKTYEQRLGKEYEGGIEPSIGQWQKLALARAFYRDPNILVLDEPTSSIDAESEAKIFEKLEQLPKDRTVILISHRFSTVRRADKICVIEDGKLKELGTHKELLKKKGTYARLFEIQAKGYK